MTLATGNLIVEKARSFARVLASSREFQEFHSAQEKLNGEEHTRSLLEKFQNKQREFHRARMAGKGLSGAAMLEVQALERQLRSNPTIMAWARAQEGAIRLIQDANQVISEAAGLDFGQRSSTSGPC